VRAGRRWGELEPQIRFAIDAKLAPGQPELEDVPAGAPVRGYEVEVVAGGVQTLGVAGEAEADEAARAVVELEGGLMFDDLREGRVGLALAGYAARLDVVEVPLDPDGVARGLAAHEQIQARTERLEVQRRGERLGQVRLEEGHDGERRPHPSVDGVGPSIRLHLVEAAVEGDHLFVQRLERAQTEISAILELGEADVAVVLPLQQRVYGRGLEERVVETLIPAEILLLEVLDVQRADQGGIYGHVGLRIR